MPQNEPTNEQLREWLKNLEHFIKNFIGPDSMAPDFADTIRALLAAREELTRRDAAVREHLNLTQEMYTRFEVECVVAHVVAERDSQIAELRTRHDGMERLMERARQERDSLRGELEAARKRADDAEDACVHWDIVQLLPLRQERDAARAGEARLREAAMPFKEAWESRDVEDFEGHGIDRWGLTTKITLPMVRDIAEALSSTADSAKWLEERLYRERNLVLRGKAEDIKAAEQRGYERACSLYDPHIDVITQCRLEADRLERQLAARREKAEEPKCEPLRNYDPAQDIVRTAESVNQLLCPECGGRGEVYTDSATCISCGGTGKRGK